MSVMWTVHQYAPGVWTWFVERAWEAYRQHPFEVTSWWRDRAWNLEVGGDADSQHLIGTAFDATPPEAAEALRAAGFRVVTYPTHCHAQVFSAGVARAAGILDAVGV